MMLEPTQDVFDVVLARPAADGCGLTHLTWRAAGQGQRLVQVYVDGVLHDVSVEPTQRAMWLQLDPTRAHAIELLAVDSADRWTDYRQRLSGWLPALSMLTEVALARDESLPIDTRIAVTVDGELMHVGPMWSATDHRGGIGGLFGEGPFGLDLATAPGLGVGEFGFGTFGAGGRAWRWAAWLAAGSHEVQVGPVDGEAMQAFAVVIDELHTAMSPAVAYGEQVVLSW